MALVKMVDLVTNASTRLQDTGFVRWTKAELLGWGNDAQREIVKYRPDAGAVHRTIELVAGTLQSIPATDLRVIRFVRNMGTDGSTPGYAIQRPYSLEDMSTQDPAWHTADAAAEVDSVVYDPEDPKKFYVSPPQPSSGQGYIEIVTSAVPAAATINGVGGSGTDSVIGVDDIYATDIFNYMMGEALSKQALYANPAAGAGYRQLFMQSMTGKAQADAAADPSNQGD